MLVYRRLSEGKPNKIIITIIERDVDSLTHRKSICEFNSMFLLLFLEFIIPPHRIKLDCGAHPQQQECITRNSRALCGCVLGNRDILFVVWFVGGPVGVDGNDRIEDESEVDRHIDSGNDRQIDNVSVNHNYACGAVICECPGVECRTHWWNCMLEKTN